MRQSQLLEEVGRDERQVVVGQVEDLRVVVDHARDGGERRVDAFHGLFKKWRHIKFYHIFQFRRTCEITNSYNSARRLIGWRIIESIAYFNQKFLALLYLDTWQYTKHVG